MLIDYKELEPLVYVQMQNAIKQTNHAYLFNLNENIYAEKMVMEFIKNLICGEHQDKKDYEKCSLCKRIEDGNYTELKKVKPDGLWIKKDQLDELQFGFSTKSLESNKRIYVIYEAEKLNKNAANCLLKFLEEPGEGIIAILLTNHLNLILETIFSRCQTISFSKNKVEDYIKFNNIQKEITMHKLMYSVLKIDKEEFITEENKKFFETIISFINNYEELGIKTILLAKNQILEYSDDKNALINFFEGLVLFYRDVLGYKINKKVLFFDDYIELIKKASKNNDIKMIIDKLNTIINAESLIKNNANVSLLIDKMIIDMEA